ncbi:MAG TPA: hypothetical protein VEF34_06180 [Syntrophobacteraceae bacterium]|nr:hypothetical protein [Syntrophobacteraceae bacterium]
MNKTANFIGQLYAATIEDKIQWDKTVEENQFQTSFTNYSIKIGLYQGGYDDVDNYELSVINSDGIEIAKINPNDVESFTFRYKQGEQPKSSYRIFREIYEKARRTALGIEQALDDLMTSLKALRTSDGKQPEIKEKKSTDDKPDDDIPF